GELLRRTDDAQFVRQHFYEALRDIITWHEHGTHYQIRMTDDGLLRAGEPGVQLTWMDAKVGDYVVTPRAGKPVEIQALWYNALRTIEEIARRFGDEQTSARVMKATPTRATRLIIKARFGLGCWGRSSPLISRRTNGRRRA